MKNYLLILIFFCAETLLAQLKNDEKANLLHKAFDYIQLAGASLVIVIILIILGKFLG